MPVPLTRPSPPRLSAVPHLLRAIEDRGVFSNFGPVNTAFEGEMLKRFFNSEGACTTVCNATIGLMLAVKNALRGRSSGGKYALMPSFTFAAAAQAAMWCGLTPLFCDIDPLEWSADPDEEERLLRQYGDEIAVVMPYATFGVDIGLARYEAMSRRHNVPVVIDAAASLGTLQDESANFGTGFSGAVVFSMHATKSFATGEGGLIYSGNPATVRDLRTMANFGFGLARNATMPGLNAKLSEAGALLGQLRLEGYDAVMERRSQLVAAYRWALPQLSFQRCGLRRQAHQFNSVLLPAELAGQRKTIQAAMLDDGVGVGAYFSPHLAEQSYFAEHAVSGPLPVTEAVASRMISLPLFDTMTLADVAEVVASLERQMAVAGAILAGSGAVVAARGQGAAKEARGMGRVVSGRQGTG